MEKVNNDNYNMPFPYIDTFPKEAGDMSESQELTLHVFPPAVQVRETLLQVIILTGSGVG